MHAPNGSWARHHFADQGKLGSVNPEIKARARTAEIQVWLGLAICLFTFCFAWFLDAFNRSMSTTSDRPQRFPPVLVIIYLLAFTGGGYLVVRGIWRLRKMAEGREKNH